MAASEVDICNRAIQKVGGQPITSLSDSSSSARAVNRCYEMLRDAELRSNNWNFAIKRTSLAASVTAPSWGFSKQYPLPSDFLRLISIRDHYGVSETIGTLGQNEVDYSIESGDGDARSILTNSSSPIYIRYVARVENTGLFDPLFSEALASKIAMEIVEEITNSNSKKQTLIEEYKMIIKQARYCDSIETAGEALIESDWLIARL